VNVKRVLDDVPIDPEAEERAWALVRVAYARHEPMRPNVRRWPLAAAVGLAAVVAATLSPPGRAVVDAVRRTIGIEHAAPALFRLPAPGRLLVSGAGGTWVVSADGSKRRLGDEVQASWSPHGLFVVAASTRELAAIEPRTGNVRWSLARPGVALPRWGGTRTDTRIAYCSGRQLRVVGGDGTGDAAARALPARIASAWRPESHVLAYATRRRSVVVVDTDANRVLTEHRIAGGARALAWSADGSRLAVASVREVELFGPGTAHVVVPLPGVRALSFARDGRLALLRARTVATYDGSEGAQTVFGVRGRLSGIAWSPNGRWLVTSLPAADQWIFLGGRRVQAVSHIAEQFGGAVSLDGWVPGP
jgi:hypothetical protein